LESAVHRRRLHEELMQMAPGPLHQRRRMARGRGANGGVDLFRNANHVGGESAADLVDERDARRRIRIRIAVQHVPGEVLLEAPELLLRILQEELHLRDEYLEPLVSGGTPQWLRGSAALGELLDRTQVED